MTVRSVILGLLCSAVLCSVTVFNDSIIRNINVTNGFMPAVVFGALVMFLLLVNPLLGRMNRRLALSGAELATVTALALFTCFMTGGLFTNMLVMPHHLQRANAGWQGGLVPLDSSDVSDWPALVARLAKPAPAPHDAAGVVAAALPTPLRQRLLASGPAGPDPELQQDVLEEMNRLMLLPSLFPPTVPVPREVPVGIRTAAADRPADPDAIREFNRSMIDVGFAGMLRPRRAAVLSHLPPHMLVDTRSNRTDVVDGFVTGLARGRETIPLRRIPWAAWRATLSFWIPMVLLACCGMIGLALMVHRQWSDHEHLPYPIASFAEALLPAANSAVGAAFRSRLFWLGMSAVATIHLYNYANRWWPKVTVPLSLRFDFQPLLKIFPIFENGWSWVAFTPKIFFSVVALSYFLATEVSLSVGIAPYVFCGATGIAALYGVSIAGPSMTPAIDSFLFVGAYLGVFVVTLYTGRHYYLATLRRSVGLSSTDDIPPYAIWGTRLFILSTLLFAGMVVSLGVAWQLAVLYTFLCVAAYVSLSRVVAETGVYFIACTLVPSAALWGFLGAKAVGPDELLILGVITSTLFVNFSENLMPMVSTGLRLVDRARGPVGPTVAWGSVALVAGLAIALVTTLWVQYQYGSPRVNDWKAWSESKWVFDGNSQVRHTLEAQGALEISRATTGWAKFGLVAPKPDIMIAFSLTFSLVLLFTFLRHRFQKWPLHPIMFIVLATWQSAWIAFSCLIGCFIKTVVTKYGGARLYQRLKPLMIGMIAGEMVGAVIPLVIGVVYYVVTGESPKTFTPVPK